MKWHYAILGKNVHKRDIFDMRHLMSGIAVFKGWYFDKVSRFPGSADIDYVYAMETLTF